jgi:hypothetical protein
MDKEYLEEVISFLAKRGDAELIQVLRNIIEEYEAFIDPDYETESETDSDCSMTDIVEEDIQLNPSLNGFESLY